MIIEGCTGCNQAITAQKREDEKTISDAKKSANTTGKPVALFRDEYGTLRICDGSAAPQMFINPEVG